MHKSNVYSIKIRNSGLNPMNDESLDVQTEEEKNKALKINNIRKNMRNSLESAIRNSIKKYMPVETTLWKIIYEGK